jgi:hypothetical protein
VAFYAETKIMLFLQSEMQRLINTVWCDAYQVKQVETVTVTNNPVSNIDSTPTDSITNNFVSDLESLPQRGQKIIIRGKKKRRPIWYGLIRNAGASFLLGSFFLNLDRAASVAVYNLCEYSGDNRF